ASSSVVGGLLAGSAYALHTSFHRSSTGRPSWAYLLHLACCAMTKPASIGTPLRDISLSSFHMRADRSSPGVDFVASVENSVSTTGQLLMCARACWGAGSLDGVGTAPCTESREASTLRKNSA